MMMTSDIKIKKSPHCLVSKMFRLGMCFKLISIRDKQYYIMAIWLGMCMVIFGSSVKAFSVESRYDISNLFSYGYDGEIGELANMEKRGYEDTELDTNARGISQADNYFDVIKRYMRPNRGWGHRSRYPWKRLPDTMCYQQQCKRDKDCCMRHNICDKSAKICRDCWYGSRCKREENCCHAFPYCLRRYVRDPNNKGKFIKEGKCVDAISRLRTFGHGR